MVDPTTSRLLMQRHIARRRGLDPPEIWLPPGGGVERDETLVESTIREVQEETGHVLSAVPLPLAVRRVHYERDFAFFDATAYYHVMQVEPFEPVGRPLAESEQGVVEQVWMTPEELRASPATLVPPELDQILAAKRPLTTVGGWGGRRLILTIGHSNRSFDAFASLLEELDVRCVVDVRSAPWSKRFPHFGRDPLREGLSALGIAYRHLSALGGRRPQPGPSADWAGLDPKWWGYALHMRSDGFARGLEALSERVEEHGRVALMCAERDHRHCHRRLLSDALRHRGHAVLHVGADATELRPHLGTPEVWDTPSQFSYPERQTSLFDASSE
jgi:8-oxo-dGTP pyrophosphatase MutT (NUDIX family)